MEKMEYVREGGVNYLRFQIEGTVDYRMEMLVQNQLEGFLPIELRRMDEWEWVYCRISGLISLSQCLEKERLGEQALLGFLNSVEQLCRSMEEYLLPFEGLILRPEYIYVRPGNMQKYYWIYSCTQKEAATEEQAAGEERIAVKEAATAESLLEYLLDRLDYEEQKAVKLLYSIYQSCRRESQGGDIELIRNAYRSVIGEGEQERMETGRVEGGKVEGGRAEGGRAEGGRAEGGREEGGREERKGKSRQVRRIFPGTDMRQEGMLYPGRDSNPGISYLEETLQQKHYAGSNHVVQEDSAWKGSKIPEVVRTETEQGDWKNRLPCKIRELCATFLGKRERTEQIERTRRKEQAEDRKEKKKEKQKMGRPARTEIVVKPRTEPSGGEAVGTTLLTGGMMGGGIYCLRARNLGYPDLLLTSYPFFIGKDETKMDGVVEDAYVSRYHARIDREEDGFRILDLGSTNGTFVNRERLAPYEARTIQEGDSLMFAHREYEFSFLT